VYKNIMLLFNFRTFIYVLRQKHCMATFVPVESVLETFWSRFWKEA